MTSAVVAPEVSRGSTDTVDVTSSLIGSSAPIVEPRHLVRGRPLRPSSRLRLPERGGRTDAYPLGVSTKEVPMHTHAGSATRSEASWQMAAQATLHCLTGCAIGEVLGMVIGTAAGLS